MTPINLALGQLVVRGQLFDEYPDASDLDQDILEVDLQNGLTVSVSWFPEYDPSGHFEINVYRQFWTNKVRPTVVASSPNEAAELVRRFVGELSADMAHTSLADSLTSDRLRI